MATFYENLGSSFYYGGVWIVKQQNVDTDILVGGSFSYLNGQRRYSLVRLNSDGTEDDTFHSNSSGSAPSSFYVWDIAIHSSAINNKILVSYVDEQAGKLVRLNLNGTEDTAFSNNIGTGPNNGVHSVEVQSDDKILVGGYFNQWSGSASPPLIRLNTDGTLDSSFNSNVANVITDTFDWGETSGTSFISDIAVQSDGKIIACGGWTDSGSYTAYNLVRLNSDGTEDTSGFNSNIGSTVTNYGGITKIAIDGSGDILLGGQFSNWNGTDRAYSLVKLDSSGSLDTTFDSNLGGSTGGIIKTIFANDYIGFVSNIEVLSSGKYLISGNFNKVNTSTYDYIVFLNSNGTIDSGSSGNLDLDSQVLTTYEQADGKILIGGNFTENKGVVRKRLFRVNGDGTEDTSGGTNPTFTNATKEFNGRSLTAVNVNDVNTIPLEDIYYINFALVPDLTAPSAPTGLSAANVCQSSFLLTFTCPSDTDISYANIYIKRNQTGDFVVKNATANVAPSATVSILLSGLDPNTTNDFVVTMVDSSGNESVNSSTLTVVQGKSPFIDIQISTAGYSTASGACGSSGTIQLYRTGTNVTVQAPSNGDVIWTTPCCTTPLNGNGNFYKSLDLFDDWSFTVSSTGVVGSVAVCR